MLGNLVRRLMTLCVLLAGLQIMSVAANGEAPTKLLRWVPANANAVTVIDVQGLFHSPLGMREGWKQRSADRFVNQEFGVPPDARRVVMATQLDLGGTLRPVWDMGILEFEKTPSFALLARGDGGQLDTISGHSAVRLSGNRTGVELEPGIVLATPEPNRQTISRWVGSSGNDAKPQLSEFLQTAFEKGDPKAQIILALDLKDSVTAGPIRTMLEGMEVLKGKTADQADIADLLASVQGVILSVHVTDKREGQILVQFGKPATLLKPVAKPVVDEVLGALEISLADLDAWTAEVSGSSLLMKGEFSEGDMRQISSLFVPSPAARDVQEPAATSAEATPSPEAAKVDASKKYFHSVKSFVEDLRKQLNKSRDNQLVWMERYARKIDDLPMIGVDPDLLTFGGNVSSSFRYQAQAGRMGALRAGVREAQPVYQSYSYGAGAVGPYGSYAGYSNYGTVRVSPERNQIRTEERASASQVKVSEMKNIEDGMVQIRRKMTERYQTEF